MSEKYKSGTQTEKSFWRPMDGKRKQFWSKLLCSLFVVSTMVACGKQEEPVINSPAPPPETESRAANPELYAKDAGVSDTAAYVPVDTQSVLGINLVDNDPSGALITSVVDNSQASRLNLQTGDIIVQVGDLKISTANDFETLFHSIDNGITTEVVLVRNGATQSIELLKM